MKLCDWFLKNLNELTCAFSFQHVKMRCFESKYVETFYVHIQKFTPFLAFLFF